MRINPHPVTGRARLCVRLAALASMVMFVAATFTCTAGAALESGHEHDHDSAPGHHHGQSDTDHGDQHDGDSGNCCATLKSPVPSAPQQAFKPHQASWSVLTVIALLPVSSALTPPTGVLFDHGPPGQSPPEFLFIGSRFSRGPPHRA